MRNSGLKTLLVWLTSLAGICLAGLTAAKAADLPAGLWDPRLSRYPNVREHLLTAMFVLTMLLQPIFALQALRGDARRKEEKRTKTIQEGCNLLLTSVCNSGKSTSKYATSFGVHTWKLKKKWWSPSSLKISRLTGFRLYRAQQSGVKWKEGCGAIGYSLKWDQDSFFDLTKLNQAGASGRAIFEALPEDDRLGMNFADWEKTKSYTGIAVWLLKDKAHNVCGILTFDCTNFSANDVVGKSLKNPVARGIVATIAAAVAGEE